jgi:PAS domain S-box-containing protein
MTLQIPAVPATTPIGVDVAKVSLEQLHLLLDRLQAMVGYFDTNNRCIYANHAYAKAFRTTVQEMLGKHTREIIGEEGWAFIEPYTLRAMAGEAVRYVREVDAGQGSSRWIEVHIVPNVLGDGKIFGGFVFIDDVTEQYRAQQAIRESEERTQRFIAAGTEGVVFYRAGIIFDCNDAFQAMLGKGREELVGMPASHLFQKPDRSLAEKHMHLGLSTSYSARLPRADGTFMSAEITGKAVMVNGQSASVAVVKDTTQIATMNEALVSTQARYRFLVDNSDQSAFFTQDRKITYANPAAQRLFGPHPDGLRGVESLYLIHPDDRANALKRRKELIAGDTNTEVIVRCISPPAAQLQSDSRITWVRLHGSILEWEGSIGVLIFLTDITALRESEEKMRKALAQEKELGDLKTRFVSMASHEFRTPLATIQTSSELLEHYSDRLSQAERNDAVADIQRSVQRMQTMMDRFLAFGRIDSGSTMFSPRPVYIANCLQVFLQETQVAHASKHAVDLTLESPLSSQTKLMLDETLLSQMVINIFANACKYSAQSSKIQILAGRRVSKEGAHLRISVQDQGIGIPPEELPRLFESFYRASNVNTRPGTGLGLAIADRAARAHGGRVLVESTMGQGSLFTLSLPWVDAV